ncbi:MAG: HlyD family efflux transporter periplasmic adaptor subunit [Myxococcota bacterium]
MSASPKNEAWKRRLLLGGGATLIIAALVWAYQPRPQVVDVAEVSRGELVVTVVEDGRTRIRDRYVVSSPLRGELERLELDTGDLVERGQVVARVLPAIEPLLDRRSRDEARARVQAAEAAVKRAEAAVQSAEVAAELSTTELKRSQKLADEQVLAALEYDRLRLGAESRQAELEAARFGARVAHHELDLARSALERSTEATAGRVDGEELLIRAPVDGVVLKVFNESQVSVQAGTPILSLGDPARLEVVVDVLTRDAVKMKPGGAATVQRWGGEAALEARIRRIEPTAFTDVSALGVEEQRVDVVLDLIAPQKAWAALGDGYRVEAHIVTDGRSEALLVPEAALFRHAGEWAVFGVKAGRALRTPVQIGIGNDEHAELLSGLQAGEAVILYPSDLVEEGIRVTARTQAH